MYFPCFPEIAFDSRGCPLEPAFYTGSPGYHNLVYEIYQHSELLEEAEPVAEVGVTQEPEGYGQPAAMYWVKKGTLSNIITEEVSDEQVF